MRVRFTAMITCMVLLTCLLTACGDSSTSNESDGVLDPVNQASEGNGNFNVTGYPIVNEPVKPSRRRKICSSPAKAIPMCFSKRVSTEQTSITSVNRVFCWTTCHWLNSMPLI